jgi:hypothetical protein
MLHGIFIVLAFGSGYAIFGTLNVLAFGNVHDLGDVHAAFTVLTSFLRRTCCA